MPDPTWPSEWLAMVEHSIYHHLGADADDTAAAAIIGDIFDAIRDTGFGVVKIEDGWEPFTLKQFTDDEVIGRGFRHPDA